MDDLFFTDNNNNKRNNKNTPKRPSRDEFITDSDYIDDFIDTDTGSGSKFSVNIPDDDFLDLGSSDIFSQKPSSIPAYSDNTGSPTPDPRTPKGRPIQGRSPLYSDSADAQTVNPSRTPKGKPVPQGRPNVPPIYSDYRETPRSPASRTPQGKPVSNGDHRNVNVPPAYAADGFDNAFSDSPKAPQGRAISADISSGRPMPASTPENPKRPNYFATDAQGGKKKKKKKKKGVSGKKIAAAIFAIIVVCLAALFCYGYSILGKINYDTNTLKENQYISESKLMSDSKVKNILFIGSDFRTGEVTGMRSDTMMLFSIDTAHKKLKLTSFLRDSYVYIPSLKKNRKLNAACNSGGAQLVIDTIEYNFKVKIDNYILVDFEAFKKLIDLMGGLTIEGVTAKEAKYLRETVKIDYVKEGTNKFTGGAALWYCRIRYLDDDFHRTERQRKVISAIINQAKHLSPLQLVNIMQQVLPMISTDISRNELLSLGVGAVTSYLRYDTSQHQVPATGTWSSKRVYGEGLVLSMDIDKNSNMLKDFIYSDKDESK